MSGMWSWGEVLVIVTTPRQHERGDADALRQTDVVGFDVEATDGHIGKVDEATYDTGGSYLVADTGWWIFGKKRVIPAGLVERVDSQKRVVHLRVSKDVIKDAPDYRPDSKIGDWQSEVGEYYGT